MNGLNRITSAVLVLTIACLGLPLPAQAAMIGTQAAAAGDARARIEAALDRAEVRAKLQEYGVSVVDAKARVAALTDEEAASLAGKIDTLPAGGFIEDLISAALIVFLVLLVTDILGYTKVFPFTRPIEKRR